MTTTYVCAELVENVCKTWVVSESWLDSLAITQAQAWQITAAICTLIAVGYVIGEIGGLIKRMGK